MKRILPAAVVIIALVAIAVVLLTYERNLLWKVQEMNLFLYSGLYFKEMMVTSAGFLSYLGTYFTQHFYYPWLGVLLLCGCWVLLAWMTKRVFCIPNRWTVLLLIPIALLLMTAISMGYWMYVIKLKGYFWTATIATLVVVALMWAFKHLPRRRILAPLFLFLTVVIGYPLFGTYILWGVLLMAVWSWRLEKQRSIAILNTIVGLISVIAIPLLYYRLVYYQTNILNIYWTGLPLFKVNAEGEKWYYLPYILLFLFYLVLAATYREVWYKPEPVTVTHRQKKAQTKEKRSSKIKRYLPQTVLLIALVYGVWHFWFKDENFHHELAMQRCVENLDWEGVMKEADKQKDMPSRSIVIMRNIALTRLGRAADIYNYPNGDKSSNAPFPIMQSNMIGRMLYYNYGALNECHHYCIEEAVEFGWKAQYLKYLACCAMLTGEEAVAKKYFGLLRQTRYFGKWADEYEPMNGRKDMIEKSASMGPICHMLQYDNSVGSDSGGQAEKYLMRLLAQLDSKNPYFQEQTLLAAMWTKNPKLFWSRFTQYIKLHPNDPMPRIYQEAAYLFCQLEDRPTDNIPFDKEVISSFNAIVEKMEQYDGMDLEQVRNLLYPSFGHTYYYDYFLMDQLNYN
ncbi:MAG: hypothetical protein IKX65_11160 [Prevotella sp.]|nr:hypothetical protein [Prevotella sp.]